MGTYGVLTGTGWGSEEEIPTAANIICLRAKLCFPVVSVAAGLDPLLSCYVSEKTEVEKEHLSRTTQQAE